MSLTRLAPSPTGALHLGNARTFLVNWALARQSGWRVLLRIEDIDGPRIKAGAAQQAIDDLRWLGIDWDEGPVVQSTRLPIYAAAVEQLLQSGAAYPCVCSRSEVASAASAPHAEDGSVVYPGICRDRFADLAAARATGREPAIRFRVPERRVAFVDQFAGPQAFDVARELGDFVIAKADGTPAYQLAVVLDDAASGVTDIVRGADLIDSTPRQLLLYEALGLAPTPRYYHLPLITGPDGRRLAKRHGDTRLSHYREQGVPAERVLALLARWSGVPAGEAIAAGEFCERFELAKLPREAVVCAAEDDAWLRR